MNSRRCKDCPPDLNRPAIHPGPRCATCWRAEKKRRATNKHSWGITNTYGINRQQYDQLFASQGGRCSICRIANGTKKRLAVDHDHHTGEIRGLLCGPCNLMLGRLGDRGLLRALDYLAHPPARKVPPP